MTMAYLNAALTSFDHLLEFDVPQIPYMPDLSRAFSLKNSDRERVVKFLNERPVHTVAMVSFILDNGIESPLNRGEFYGYHDRAGNLEGVALIGHTTLVETRTSEALSALAIVAQKHADKIHVIMSGGDKALDFWATSMISKSEPRLVCREMLFELGFPFPVRPCGYKVRLATPEELLQVAEAQAEVAFIETGHDPMARDLEGFLQRVLRRIEQGRVYVVVESGRLLFKADVVSLTDQTAYLEGVYVAGDRRGEGVGSDCLAEVGLRLLNHVQNVCLLSNVGFTGAHRSFEKAGFRNVGECTTVLA